MSWRRFDSLFARLLALQLLLVLVLMLLFGAYVYVERNVAVARLVAERWAPALKQAAGLPGEAATARLQALQQRDDPPAPAWRSALTAPRMAALADELRLQGVPLQELLVARGEGGPQLWLALRHASGRSIWVGLSDAALLPQLPNRLWTALGLMLLLLVGLSWGFTHRLMRPLKHLHARMQSHQPGEPARPGPALADSTPELAAIEAAYADLLQRYERHERERALLLAGVSHDLRGPLTRIRTAAALLPEDADSATWREAIVRNTQVADRLIEAFLDHVRAGELALDGSADLALLARQAAAGHAQPVELQAPESLLLGHTHSLLLERLLANLLDNAFKHGRPPVRLFLSQVGEWALLEISDAGPGVAPAQREALQQAFARGDAARGTPGTGLGLAIVARVVARMGGSLDFLHSEGRHRVRVQLPIGPSTRAF